MRNDTKNSCHKGKRRFKIVFAQKIVIKNEATKNGPNAILCLIFALPIKSKVTPTIEPKIKAVNIQSGIYGKPSIKPINTANFTSPKPMPFPRVAR